MSRILSRHRENLIQIRNKGQRNAQYPNITLRLRAEKHLGEKSDDNTRNMYTSSRGEEGGTREINSCQRWNKRLRL